MNLRNNQAFYAALVLALGLVLAAFVVGQTFLQARAANQTIVVTGSAKRRITSDRVIWRANVSYQAEALADAYRALSAGVPRVKAYLVQKGVPEDQITVSAI